MIGKWVEINDYMPTVYYVSPGVKISGMLLVWLNSGEFTCASVIVDATYREIKWITGYNGVDISDKVTHWATIAGPNDSN